jgi:hypothetical protein
MKIKTIYVIVDHDRELINKLCRIAFGNYWEIDGWNCPKNLRKFSDTELEELIEDCGTYKARTLVFKERGVLEINFLRLRKASSSFLERIDDGHNPDELKLAIEWIKEQKFFVGLAKFRKKD